MSVTITRVPDGNDVWGRTRINIVDVTLDSSYPLTNGYVIQASDVGLKGLFGAQVIGGNKASGAVLPAIDLGTVAGAPAPTSAILRLFLPTGGGTAPATLTAPVGGTAGAITVTNGAITVTNGAITAGAHTVAAGGTPVTSTAANGTGIVSEATPSQATTTASQATTTASQATGGALVAGIGKEVGNTTDVSSIIVRLLFMGR